MSKVRALAFVCFMASMATLASVNAQANSVLGCQEQEWCNEFEGCGGACECTCDNLNPWPQNCNGGPPPETYSDGFCTIPYSTE